MEKKQNVLMLVALLMLFSYCLYIDNKLGKCIDNMEEKNDSLDSLTQWWDYCLTIDNKLGVYINGIEENNNRLDSLIQDYNKLKRRMLLLEKIGDTGSKRLELEQVIKAMETQTTNNKQKMLTK